ncbi:hypothetical protein EVAR_12831_1 [Eumeta japonica]|uniref:Uncharacterized protein n=1 Tax=Eumeta variegata TaxID=151549 RepID=A0A4C1UB34_EUMVA|nr:hypothetical protein EVAR_12831_1 [Eumeta japonica]
MLKGLMGLAEGGGTAGAAPNERLSDLPPVCGLHSPREKYMPPVYLAFADYFRTGTPSNVSTNNNLAVFIVVRAQVSGEATQVSQMKTQHKIP